MQTLSEKLHAMITANQSLGQLIAEGKRQHAEHKMQFAAMVAVNKQRQNDFEANLESMRKELQRHDNIRKPPLHHVASSEKLDAMITEGLRQHQEHYEQIEAMAEKELLRVNERERVLESMRKELQRRDHLLNPVPHRMATHATDNA